MVKYSKIFLKMLSWIFFSQLLCWKHTTDVTKSNLMGKVGECYVNFDLSCI